MAAEIPQIKLSNVLGAPFDKYVLTQLYLRAAKNSTVNRSTDDVLFLANKTAWARLISSVNISIPEVTNGQTLNENGFFDFNAYKKSLNAPLNKYISSLGLNSTLYPTPESLAKDWILEAGTSKANGQGIDLRYGLGPDGAYGLGGTEELGYRPMPGLTSVVIDTAGRLGSLRFATISFKVWNLTQLNVIEALYFRLGYTMLLEWGHTQYYSNPDFKPGNNLQTAIGTFGIDDPFVNNISISTLQQTITNKKFQTSGNYDGMVGIVTNFNWSLNQEGGYDCTVRLTGKGAIIDSLRINQSNKMPDGVLTLAKQYGEQLNNIIQKEQEKETQLKKQAAAEAEAKRIADSEAAGFPAKVPQNLNELWKFATKFDNYKSDFDTFKADEDYWWYTSYNLNGVSTVPDYYYTTTDSNKQDYNKKWLGLFINKGGANNPWKVLHNDPGVSRFSLDNIFLEQATEKALKENYNAGNSPTVRGKIQAIKDVQNLFAKVFEYEATNPNGGYCGPNDPLKDQVSANIILNNAQVQYQSGVKTRDFYITVKYLGVRDPLQNAGYIPTRSQISKTLDQWLKAGATTVLQSIETFDPWLATSYIQVIGRAYPPIQTAVVNLTNKTERKLNAAFEITLTNTSFIQDVLTPLTAETQPTAQKVEAASGGSTEGSQNNAASTQTTAPAALESSLHLMLSVIKNAAEVKGSESTYGVVEIPLIGTGPNSAGDVTSTFFKAGVLSEVLNAKQLTNNANGVPYDLVKYAQKGFNSYLMANPKLYDPTPFVNFDELAKAYLVKYTFSSENQTPGFTNSPVYVKLGYLLALINNLCLIYDSDKPEGVKDSKGAKKEPYVYIDFNPETNFCLTSPQHLSIDPKVCLVPFNGTQADYLKIFPNNQLATTGESAPFNPKTQDHLSFKIKDFKTDNPYKAKTMNILLNIDYLLGKIDSFASSDAEHGVYLKGFLDAIVVDINKSLGNQNNFRVAYRDDSNTVQILDDQFVPNGIIGNKINIAEADIMDRNSYINSSAPLPSGIAFDFEAPKYGQLPIFGLQSLVRNVQFKTNIATKLASMIAISAQSTTASVNATDPTSLSYLNQNFQDRYKPYINNAGNSPDNTSNNATTGSSNDIKVANEFNSQVISVYSVISGSVDTTRTDTAKNYYINRISNTKAGDPVTAAAPFIPADLEMTVDGISGIVMGNAFTIPENRLPNSLKGTDGFTKVGFIVSGLTHTIQDNQWLTKIKGQMIKLRESVNYGKTTSYNTAEVTTPRQATDCKTSYPNLPIITTTQVEFLGASEAISYLKRNYPDVGLAVYALLTAEAAKSGDSFRSAGGNNFGGVQTDSGVWGFGTFTGQFCRRDSSNTFRMFAAFSTPYAFLDFIANRLKSKGFTNDPNQWTITYINKWWSPEAKASYTKGTPVYNEKLAIFKTAEAKYNRSYPS